jgi:hypothetical protein
VAAEAEVICQTAAVTASGDACAIARKRAINVLCQLAELVQAQPPDLFPTLVSPMSGIHGPMLFWNI